MRKEFTNEEQAAILSGMALGLRDGATKEKFDIAMKMGEWKDKEIRVIIDKEIDRANSYFDGHKSKVQMSASVRVVYLLSEFLGETFPKERFHFGFATND